MEFKKDAEKKNPIFWGLVAFVLGVTLLIWGWDKYESTSADRAKGSTLMLIIGGISLLTGLGLWFKPKKKAK